MRRIIVCATVLMLAGIVHGQAVKPDDMKKLLNEAQDRKAELAMENARLSSQIRELEKANKAQAAEIDDLKRKAASFADRTLFLSTQYAAWSQFINLNPAVRMQWVIFEDAIASVSAGQSPFFMDGDWPLSVKRD